MAKLAGAASPQRAIDEGLYVPLPGRSVADHIVTGLELQPTSSHLVVGGVGSGKSTQLLIAAERLNKIPDTRAFYIDVGIKHDLARFQSGVLLVLAGLALTKYAKECKLKEAESARESFRRWAGGWEEWVEDEPDEGPPDDWPGSYSHLVKHAGLLAPASRPLGPEMVEMMRELKDTGSALRTTTPHLVVLFDSLDRLVSPPLVFVEQVEQDVRAIQKAGVGVALVGPLRALFGSDRAVADYFDYFHPQFAVDTARGQDGRAFLASVLRKRASADILPDESLEAVIELSGGVLRDAINLAKGAGQEAYIAGSETVNVDQVKAAGDTIGRELMMGLGPRELEVLRRVQEKGQFVPTSETDIALLVRRRVIEYGSGQTRFKLHPTLLPLLEQAVAGP